MSFSARLQQYRKEGGFSQEGLAKQIGVSRQAISKWESGAGFPDLEKTILLCRLFGCTADELLNPEAENGAAGESGALTADARTIGKNVKSLRTGRGISQEEFAERLNVSRQSVSKWETGSALPKTETLVQMLDILRCPADALLFAGNEKRREQSYVGHVEYVYEIPQALRSGWESRDGRWYYIEDDEAVRDTWRYIGGRYYCFDGAGRMIAQSWHKDGPLWYFLGADGAMLSGQWLHFDDAWFYLEADGRMATDVFVPDPRGWCYVDADGEWDGRYHDTKPIGPGVRIVGEQEH